MIKKFILFGVLLSFLFAGTAQAEEKQWLNRVHEVAEVVTLWAIYLEENNIKQSDPRWKHLVPNAIALIESLIEFDYLIPYEQLPPIALEELHLIIAVIPIHESGLKPHAIGDNGKSIGMFQIKDHYPRMGFSRREIRESQYLQVRTGVRWFLKHMSVCKNLGRGKWSSWHWLLAYSVYQAGTHRIGKTGECFAISGAKKRLRTFKRLKKLVRKEFVFR